MSWVRATDWTESRESLRRVTGEMMRYHDREKGEGGDGGGGGSRRSSSSVVEEATLVRDVRLTVRLIASAPSLCM